MRGTPSVTGSKDKLFSELETHRRYLWSVCYRMTGSAADADDLVQDTFARALEKPPRDTSLPWRPWLVKVSMNLARDQLRRRRRQGYVGQWLPEPVELSDDVISAAAPDAERAGEDQERRYSTLESLSFAFLLALETLTPAQRAVLLLRDAMDYSVRETAHLLEMSESNVKVTLHRARKAMSDYEEERRPPNAELVNEVRGALAQLLTAMSLGDVDAIQHALADGALAISDGGGVTFAGKKPVAGAEKIARMYVKLARGSSPDARLEIREVNGMPALLGHDPSAKPPAAAHYIMRIELNARGKVRRIHSVLNPAKLRAFLA